MVFDPAIAETSKRTGSAPDHYFTNPAKFDGHLRIYPTLACNLRCAYCVNEAMGQRPHIYGSVQPDAWIAAIRREQRHVVLTGGEPFLYKGLTDLINGVGDNLRVRVYSNFCLDLRAALNAIGRPVHFYISWHPQVQADRDVFLENLKVLQGIHRFTADIHAIDATESGESLKKDLAYFKEQGFPIGLDSDQRTFEGAGQPSRSLAVCSKNIYLIGPDGTRFQCVSRLIRNDAPMENIFDGPLGPPAALSECPDFGNCAPCDALGETKIAVF